METGLDDGNGTGARAGLLRLNGRELQTPAFMPVGTLGTVKTLSTRDIIETGAQCILGNTYHLHLRPGEDVVAEAGGLHAFMGGWPGLILTDSGGFQVFSLAHLRTIDDDGVAFRAHTDGSLHRFTPETVVAIQVGLGSDIAMVLDECTAFGVPRERAIEAATRTFRWAERARAVTETGASVLFGITQGGMFEDLRHQSSRDLASLDFPGYAIGGLGLGETKREFRKLLRASTGALPPEKPRYLMGIGAPEDLIHGVQAGVDMFDCVLQTREARTGGLLTQAGRVNITNSRFARDFGPIEDGCDCSTCVSYSRAYVHHLFRNRELTGYRLATLHNVRWTIRLMETVRGCILAGTFDEFALEFLAGFKGRGAHQVVEGDLEKDQGQQRPRTNDDEHGD
jgi:queuine tRNA-ribosyltransferase